MIQDRCFPTDPWCLRETDLRLEWLAQTESLFALSNGHLGLRGNLDEGQPTGLSGTYLGGFYEELPLTYPEAGYGYPPTGRTAINVTNGKVIRLVVEDEPFEVRYGELRSHERVLDFRGGVLRRTAEWMSPTGRLVRISSTRLVSFTDRTVAAILYEVEPLREAFPVTVQSELVANELVPVLSGDPRGATALASPLVSHFNGGHGARGLLVHTTKVSGLTVGAAMDHVIDGPPDTASTVESFPDLARLTITATVAPANPLRLVKFLGYGWSSERTVPAVQGQVAAAVAGARHTGWDGLIEKQRQYLDDFWDRADVELDGDPELQQAVRFALFHALQAGARSEQRAIAAKGLTGPGYDGHTFWDMESFVLPVLTYTVPHAARDALRWRHSTIGLARDQAKFLGLKGAAFPWRTIHGDERSGYWPAGTAAFHVNADIADAVVRYWAATGDESFDRDVGVELLVETARLWRSVGHHSATGTFRIDGVTGPDEYSAVADNNVYTNLMARRNLRAAADAAERHPERAADLGVDRAELAAWREAADAMSVPYDRALGVHPQADGFTEHEVWDFERTKADHYPLLLHFPYFDLYRKQVVKQADLVLALYRCGDAFTAQEKDRNFDYYERLTVRDSSLSASIQAVVAAEVGHLQLAYDYFAETALIDLDDLQRNTRDGLHVASLAGAWIVAVAGFGGMRDHEGSLAFTPRLPSALNRLTFRLCYRGRRLRVDVTQERAAYTLTDGPALEIIHHQEPATLTAERAVTLPIPPASARPAPRQPSGRAPARRAPEDGVALVNRLAA